MADALAIPAQKKAATTDKWTEILFRALSSRVAKRWRFVSFRGAGGGEWRGVVDVLAIRKNTVRSTHAVLMSGDLFDIILIQMKGGAAKSPSPADLARLRTVARRYKASAIVLFEWKRGEGCTFNTLRAGRHWAEVSAKSLFG